jgi:D-tyrosyl-tRNA(Tyr) deacylase
MRAVVQRVSSASVSIEDVVTARIGHGLVILLGIQKGDTAADVEWLATKVANLRIFADADEKMNLSLLDVGRPGKASHADRRHDDANALVVSQFTLLASTRKGNRPSFNDAAAPTDAIPLYELFLSQLGGLIKQPIQAGTFGAMMKVNLVNDGPVTLILDSKLRE